MAAEQGIARFGDRSLLRYDVLAIAAGRLAPEETEGLTGRPTTTSGTVQAAPPAPLDFGGAK